MKATFGAGCFWQVEAEFRRIEGVTATAAGYAGGTVEAPTYEQVCTGATGHAEVVEVTFDPARVSYGELLDVYWKTHDPTQLNRQGPDVGTQYRSVIFTHNAEQEATATAARGALQAGSPRPIVTEIAPAGDFWPAEDYHQRYLEKRGLASCRMELRVS
ncbi:MAG: peptide-methionine (S)-S-oxide reductase MsrA [Actinobacteria bacterium]|nr:peptide-methionine (S)-S-oxide reductase MsrA [Actinomycetota bacterium]MDQ3221951.1 peptide-methionine (S)-S-oxide reductase MsrA [Gemmatimonadota bacterium]